MEPLQKRLITNDQQSSEWFFSKLWVTIRGNGWLYVIQIKRLEVATHIPDSSIVLAQSRPTSGTTWNWARCGPDLVRHWLLYGMVCSIFKGICTKKIYGYWWNLCRLVKTCANELTPAFCPIFQRIPSLWGKNYYSGSQEKKKKKENCAFRPIALTINIMKCFERLVVNVLKEQVKLSLDPLQSTEDAINCIFHLVKRHLEDTQAYACLLLFADKLIVKAL